MHKELQFTWAEFTKIQRNEFKNFIFRRIYDRFRFQAKLILLYFRLRYIITVGYHNVRSTIRAIFTNRRCYICCHI